MSISLPTNKTEKWARYKMLIGQGYISYVQAVVLYIEYCQRLRLIHSYQEQCIEIGELSEKHLVK